MLTVSTYVFPLVATPLLVWAWWRIAGGDWRLVALVLAVPLVFGYIVAWVATGVIKRWRVTSGWRIGGAHVHHGFVYASKMAFVLLLATRDPLSVRHWDFVAVVLLVGAATAFGGWLHDLHAIREGKIEFVGLDARAAEEALASFAPASYFTIGATYAAVTIWGWRIVAEHPASFPWVFVSALALLFVIPTVVLLALDPESRRRVSA
jgi:hypothetical protein